MNSPIFILSTGRTGTQFFEEYINQTSERTLCKHEPKPSRRFKFLSNMYLNNKISDKTIINIYELSRKKIFKNIGKKTYIESSNFIFGCIPALNNHYPNIKIIHIVRHPVNYVISHLNHGFWKGHKKLIAKHVPYWLEKLDSNEYESSIPIKILATRWNYVNKQIESYSKTNEYLFIKFEDLFTKETMIASKTLNKVREFCGISLVSEQVNDEWIRKPKNISTKNYNLTSLDRELIFNINKKLMQEYEYDK